MCATRSSSSWTARSLGQQRIACSGRINDFHLRRRRRQSLVPPLRRLVRLLLVVYAAFGHFGQCVEPLLLFEQLLQELLQPLPRSARPACAGRRLARAPRVARRFAFFTVSNLPSEQEKQNKSPLLGKIPIRGDFSIDRTASNLLSFQRREER